MPNAKDVRKARRAKIRQELKALADGLRTKTGTQKIGDVTNWVSGQADKITDLAEELEDLAAESAA